ncbi:zinc finger protein 90 isoform X2 [Amyelois transitella]|nr:zinc finger protein 90 isoform X2 [Amyelois transitella]XP_013191332.2 zinc finger protein 90 isoform X2 [Amyelois transitella]XP_060807831.1 zinc finger protein 90 isoform X2 [Amyelois transitella]XP_060807836.1 zinc finger protein 90 isoform X2 [Amyelois transitella]
MSVKDLCRLCAKREDLSKDLLDSNNKNVLKLIQDLIQITVTEGDSLPTKICLNCEERIVAFQLYILECYKVQENLKKVCAENLSVKIEYELLDFESSVIKSEVKDELNAEDIVLSAINNVSSISEYEGEGYDNFDDQLDTTNSDQEDDEGDNVTLAQLKKEKVGKRRKGPNRNTTILKGNPKKSNLNIKDYVQMECDLCGLKAKSWTSLQEHHSEIHNGELTLVCICGFKINSKSVLYNHVLSHEMQSGNLINKSDDDGIIQTDLNYCDLKAKHFVKLNCNICGEKAKTWAVLEDHYTNVHQSKMLVSCLLCGFSIKSRSVLYKHVLEHKIETEKSKTDLEEQLEKRTDYCNLKVKDFVDFSCLNCNKKFTSWYSLKAHTQSIHKTQPMVRCVCGVSLSSKTVLYKHVQDHKNPNSFCCDKCPRITKTLEALDKHKMMHVPKSDRKFYCSSCDKIFNTKDSLKSHEKSHIPIEERKVYRCGICDMKFTTRSSAASHKRVVHDKIKSYVCDLCGYACGTNGELRQHRAIHSDDKPFVCRKCYKSFKTHSNLSTHMDTHEETSYTCGVCNRVLNSRRTLRKHLLVHEERCRHVCDYCNKAFKRRQTLKVHLYTHTGDKPLTCKWCDERFAYASTLRSHRMRCHPDKMPPPNSHQNTYRQYEHVPPEEYIKSDLAAIGLEKDQTETILTT